MSITAKDCRDTERVAEAAAMLRDLLPPGATATTVVEHVSTSGMSRAIRVLVPDESYPGGIRDVSHLVALVTGWGIRGDRRGVHVTGAGMDMGFHLIYTLSSILYRDTPPALEWAHKVIRHDGTYESPGYWVRQVWA